ncbi:MAG: hypothetical protein GQ574_19565 [Crocinitomix sp.]|nr:hypothetical protein [Crocinitomix sp.]
MKRLLLFSTLSLLIVACVNQKNEKRYLPNEVEKAVYFNMPLADFKALKGSKAEIQDDGMDFRKVFFESVGGTLIEYFGYYFDADNNQPLYEIIIGYNDETTLNSEAVKLLGAPNYKDTEWRFELEKTHDILAWTFKKKLIIVALIPETEWHEEENPE